jgi:histidine triad (HIT) family protein
MRGEGGPVDEQVGPEQCIFCKIAAKQAPAHVAYEDARTLCFMDLFPAADGHVLVIPKRHAVNLLDCEDADLAAIGPLARRLARAMRRVFAPDGIGVFQLNGAAAGQTVFHYHVHLIPRRRGEAMHIHGRGQGDARHLAQNAARLAEALGEAG